jgi:hypothetical protein
MNKITYALALGAGLVLSLTGPSAEAAAIVQNLPTPTLTAADFNSLFQPITGAPAQIQPYQFLNTSTSGNMESQVFAGTGSFSGLYAYAYQFGVNNVSDSTGQPTSVNSASMIFNATPAPTNLHPGDSNSPTSAVYVVTDGKVGGIDLPQAAPGSVVQIPSSVAWTPGTTTGALTFQYLNPTTNTGPLQAGANSATIVVLSSQSYVNQPVSIQNANPQTVYPEAYSASGGKIQEVPAPEPATVLAWAGMISAVALVRHVRRTRAAA